MGKECGENGSLNQCVFGCNCGCFPHHGGVCWPCQCCHLVACDHITACNDYLSMLRRRGGSVHTSNVTCPTDDAITLPPTPTTNLYTPRVGEVANQGDQGVDWIVPFVCVLVPVLVIAVLALVVLLKRSRRLRCVRCPWRCCEESADPETQNAQNDRMLQCNGHTDNVTDPTRHTQNGFPSNGATNVGVTNGVPPLHGPGSENTHVMTGSQSSTNGAANNHSVGNTNRRTDNDGQRLNTSNQRSENSASGRGRHGNQRNTGHRGTARTEMTAETSFTHPAMNGAASTTQGHRDVSSRSTAGARNRVTPEGDAQTLAVRSKSKKSHGRNSTKASQAVDSYADREERERLLSEGHNAPSARRGTGRESRPKYSATQLARTEPDNQAQPTQTTPQTEPTESTPPYPVMETEQAGNIAPDQAGLLPVSSPGSVGYKQVVRSLGRVSDSVTQPPTQSCDSPGSHDGEQPENKISLPVYTHAPKTDEVPGNRLEQSKCDSMKCSVRS